MEGDLLMALRLAREGFGGGDPEKVLDMPTDLVLAAWELITFQSEYEETALEINKPQK